MYVLERERIIWVRCRRMCHDTLYAPWVQHTQAIFLSLSLSHAHTHTHTHMQCRKNHYDWRRKTSFILLTKNEAKVINLKLKLLQRLKYNFRLFYRKLNLNIFFANTVKVKTLEDFILHKNYYSEIFNLHGSIEYSGPTFSCKKREEERKINIPKLFLREILYH